MRIVLQRVSQAGVMVGDRPVAGIGRGLLLLVGFAPDDGPAEIAYWACRIPELRLFPDGEGRMNLNLAEVQGKLLVVPNFTLEADVRQGRRPSFSSAASPPQAAALFVQFVAALRQAGAEVETGEFGEHMHVSLVNDGPVTLVLDDQAAGRAPDNA